MKEFDTILKENDIVAKNDYWAYPNNMKLYQYSSKKVGIKIHLSATVLNYKVIVKRFLKWNIKYKVGFKVSKSLKVLGELNSGVLGYSQTGKFLTLYPIQNSKYINKILISLYKMYNDINSVDIPSDTPFLNSSVVYIRYGEFKPNHKFYTDNRDGYIPQNIKRKITALNFTSYFTIPKHFKILNMIRKSSKGGVFIAWDENINKLVLLKEATKNAQMTLSGRDSVLSLYEEINLLKGMNREGYSFIPKYINAFWVNNSLFLEESYIPGKTLDEIIRNDLNENCNFKLNTFEN